MGFSRPARPLWTFACAAACLAAPRLALAAACGTTGPDARGVLLVTGDSFKQIAEVTVFNDGFYHVRLDCNGNGVFTDSIDIDRTGGPAETVRIELGGGNDTLTVLQAEDFSGTSHSVLIAAGPATVGHTNVIT